MPLSTIASLVLHLLSSKQAQKNKKEITHSIDNVISAIKDSEKNIKGEIQAKSKSKLRIARLYDQFIAEYIKFLTEFKDTALRESESKKSAIADMKAFIENLDHRLAKERRKTLTREEGMQFRKLFRSSVQIEKKLCAGEETFLQIHSKLSNLLAYLIIAKPYLKIILEGCEKRVQTRKNTIEKLQKTLRGLR